MYGFVTDTCILYTHTDSIFIYICMYYCFVPIIYIHVYIHAYIYVYIIHKYITSMYMLKSSIKSESYIEV